MSCTVAAHAGVGITVALAAEGAAADAAAALPQAPGAAVVDAA